MTTIPTPQIPNNGVQGLQLSTRIVPTTIVSGTQSSQALSVSISSINNGQPIVYATLADYTSAVAAQRAAFDTRVAALLPSE